MAFTVANVGATFGSSANISITVGAAGAGGTGHKIIAITSVLGSGTTGNIVDSVGNQYTFVAQALYNGTTSNGFLAAWRCENPIALSQNQNITFHGPSSVTFRGLNVVDIQGANTFEANVTVTATGSGSNAHVTSNPPSAIGDLFIGLVGTSTSKSWSLPSAAWTQPPVWTSSNAFGGAWLAGSNSSGVLWAPIGIGGTLFWGSMIIAYTATPAPPPGPGGNGGGGGRGGNGHHGGNQHNRVESAGAWQPRWFSNIWFSAAMRHNTFQEAPIPPVVIVGGAIITGRHGRRRMPLVR